MDFYKSDQYKQQQSENIPMLLEQMAGGTDIGGNDNNQAPQAQAPTQARTQAQNSVSIQAIENILADGYIKGNTEARYTVLEYSDFECPFCKRHHDNGTIQALVDANPDTVNYILRHFPLQNHPNAQVASEGIECAAELQNAGSFYDMKAAIFGLTSVTRAGIIQAATGLGINENDFVSCLDSGKYTEKVKSQMAE
jgi:protein-disulfide isomerase